MDEDAYTKRGYKNRHEYLKGLSEEYGLDEYVVTSLAETLGPNEDFDGLIVELDDIHGGML